MYCVIKGNVVTVREMSGRMVRMFTMNTSVIGAQVSGNNVIIQCEGGLTCVYDTTGRLVRKTKN